MVTVKSFREELEESDVIPHKSAREKSCLFRANNSGKGRTHPGGKDLCADPIIRVKEGDGAVATTGEGITSFLVNGVDFPIKEPWRSLARCADGGEEAGEK